MFLWNLKEKPDTKLLKDLNITPNSFPLKYYIR